MSGLVKEIRQIATPYNGYRVALAEFQRNVQIFDISKKVVISEFETVLDFGGRRLVVSDDGKICVCGSWEQNGICAYDTDTGEPKWQRKDLRKVQKMQILRTRSSLFTQFEIGASRLLDLETGQDLHKLNGAIGYFESKFQPVDVFDRSSRIQVVDRRSSKVKVLIGRQSFATLDIALAPESILVSESGGPLSCYDIENGMLKWRIPIDEDGHFLRLAYNEDLDVYVGVTWPFQKGGNKKVKYMCQHKGDIEEQYPINCPAETEFAIEGKVLVTSDREIINLGTRAKEKWLSL